MEAVKQVQHVAGCYKYQLDMGAFGTCHLEDTSAVASHDLLNNFHLYVNAKS